MNSKIDGGLRGILLRNLPEAHWQSIESWSTGRGVPDLNYCHNGVEGWIELKRSSAWAVDIRPEQIAWLERRARAGGRVWLMVRRIASAGAIKEAADELWIYPGSQARRLKALGLQEMEPLVKLAGGPAQWDWAQVRNIIFTT